jgi:hypothetical protein
MDEQVEVGGWGASGPSMDVPSQLTDSTLGMTKPELCGFACGDYTSLIQDRGISFVLHVEVCHDLDNFLRVLQKRQD